VDDVRTETFDRFSEFSGPWSGSYHPGGGRPGRRQVLVPHGEKLHRMIAPKELRLLPYVSIFATRHPIEGVCDQDAHR
jgi:hypothetical protein